MDPDSDIEQMDTGFDSENSDEEAFVDYYEKIANVKAKLAEDEHNVKLNNELIELLHKNGDFDELAEARERFAKRFPLNETNWLIWLKSERESENSNIDTIEAMFDRAVADSNTVAIWEERIYFGLSVNLNFAREKCEQALSAVGTRFDKGGLIWMLYFNTERSHFDMLQDQHEKQKHAMNIVNLYKRALRVPTGLLEDIYQEGIAFCKEIGCDNFISELQSAHDTTKKVQKTYEELEKVLKNENTRADGLRKYLEHETKNGDPGRIQMVHERFVEAYPDDEYVWSAYGVWCEQKLKVHSVTCQVYERAIRFCPYSCILHQQALLAYERASAPYEKIEQIWNYAKDNVINSADDGRNLYRTYIYLLRRRIAASSETHDYSPIAQIFEEGAAKLREWFPHNWDPRADYRQNQAFFYAQLLKDMDKFRAVWDDILASGFGKNAQKWIDGAKLERQFGDLQHVRKLLNKALNSVSDNVNDIYEYYVQFEREEGTLEQLDLVLEKVNAQVAHRAARPQKKKRELDEPKEAPIRKAKGDGSFKSPTLPSIGNGVSKIKLKNDVPTSSDIPVEEAKRTVFVSNLDFGTTDEQIRQVLDGVESVRFATRAHSKLHRGFGYVVLEKPELVAKALEKDRVLVNGRPMFISENDPEKRVGFKYATGLEKTKVFVRNVHFQATEEEIKVVFSKFGPVLSVRIVRHKNGQPKGVAYVEFETEDAASKSILGGDLKIRDREIAVALSDPPAKKDKKAENPKATTTSVENALPRKGHAGMLQFVPRAAAGQGSNRSGSSSPASSGGDDAGPAKRGMISESSDDDDDQRSAPGPAPLLQQDDDEGLDSEREGDVATVAKKASNLFGDDDISSSSDEDAPKKRASDKDSDAESKGSIDQLHGIVMHDPDEDPEVEQEKEHVLNTEASLPKLRTEFGDGPYYARMPNFLSVSTHPFDPELYEEDEDDDQVKMDEEGRNRLKLRVENTIRWRRTTNEAGEEVRESNAKFVKWSDGTMSLYLGNEIFEVTMMPLNANNLPQLYGRQIGGMTCQAILQKRITFRPHSTDSQTHRKVTLNMADRTRKTGQVKVMDDVGHNPEILRRENARKEEEALRAYMRRTQMVRNTFRPRNRFGGMGGGGGYSDDEEMPSRKSKGKKKEAPIIGASSDESDESETKNKKSDESDSDEEYRKRKMQQKKTIVTSDEESS
ncbi:unnamed protein product [Caenorhabditis bovis]|uniref:RRM domain-containing protein n=1 Tax=Caenorhabditis bovis TaxID=2654633 RepID=A0A8S1ET81_9PELO|nr:unnamed protein product [Caenorhabditis bovis]